MVSLPSKMIMGLMQSWAEVNAFSTDVLVNKPIPIMDDDIMLMYVTSTIDGIMTSYTLPYISKTAYNVSYPTTTSYTAYTSTGTASNVHVKLMEENDAKP